ncbi:MAG: TonB family protein [Blastocatellia bacterium]|nr:TonB family protein [Blastocatellia bacterium]
MLSIKRRTGFSLCGRAVSGSAGAILLVLSFTSASFTRDKAKAMPLQALGQTAQIGDKVEKMTQDLRPKILYKEKAKYSEEALKNGLEGTVILEAVFADDGTMKDIRTYSGLPDGLTESAIEAAKKVKFEPALKDGKPISVRGKLELEFKLSPAAGEAPAKKQESDSETIYAISASLRPTITYKEQARYTQEASDRNIYGTVILNVVFGADGKIGPIRVESGLPYGLTESAIAAARAIRFEPAQKDGKPVSVRGNLEIGFSM